MTTEEITMKTRLHKLYFGDGIIRYFVEQKAHWWSRWHYIMDGMLPRLFTKDELKSLGYEKDNQSRPVH